ncbi:porin family protein [Kingella kingae]|uniref:porin family protein n=1 Tax=Kingella kingae TaxID=504 RepID=UPI00042496E9|nr:porin family protein [Kingella kingae]MDK4528611.1 porin family protein [Kingella kingae]MDK4543181.1 porin family protein [Kingella kingae]MDK4562635.1 porin family protein [Kingella kingae]MDK4563697.1 porin family protein [Kingella kingae]MDK4578166.1 porin family protein [Kingella kingae]
MKKLVLASVLAALSGAAMANGQNSNFVGAGVGIDTGVTNYTNVEGSKNSNATNLVGSYGFEFPDTPLVGQAELKYKLGSSKIDDAGTKSKHLWNANYVQGFRVTNDLMPYAKVGYATGKFTGTDEDGAFSVRARGIIYGVGAKYAVAPNVEVGAEYVRSNLKVRDCDSDCKVKSNNVNVGVGYRF